LVKITNLIVREDGTSSVSIELGEDDEILFDYGPRKFSFHYLKESRDFVLDFIGRKTVEVGLKEGNPIATIADIEKVRIS